MTLVKNAQTWLWYLHVKLIEQIIVDYLGIDFIQTREVLTNQKQQ